MARTVLSTKMRLAQESARMDCWELMIDVRSQIATTTYRRRSCAEEVAQKSPTKQQTTFTTNYQLYALSMAEYAFSTCWRLLAYSCCSRERSPASFTVLQGCANTTPGGTNRKPSYLRSAYAISGEHVCKTRPSGALTYTLLSFYLQFDRRARQFGL